MKEKEKRTAGSGGRLARCLLLTVLFMILSAEPAAYETVCGIIIGKRRERYTC